MIPSRIILKDDLRPCFEKLRKAGIKNLEQLQAALRSKQKIKDFAKVTGLSPEYLNLLRREVNSYFPSPVNLSRFIGVQGDVVFKLEQLGIKNSTHLFEVSTNEVQLSTLLSEIGLTQSDVSELISLADISRLYGVGPAFAGILYEAGIDSVRTLMNYTGEQIREMYEEKTQKVADFTARDIDFTLEIAKELESAK